MTVFKAEPALVAGLVQLNSASQTVTNQKPKCCFSATNLSHNCNLALVAFVFLGYNIGYKGQKSMTLDQLIFKLETIRQQAGTGNLQVLSSDPYDELIYAAIITPQLVTVGEDEADLFDGFDLDTGDYYVEI